jgi:formate hydrogenlyase subunit 6/NADH:ubiquinone oxidoreductase subunit I
MKKLGTMLKDIVRAFWQRPVTEMYPFERREEPERLRGALHYSPEKCTGCCLCTKDCPSNAIELIELDKKNKRFVVRYHLDRCTFCAQCVQNCRFNCMDMSNEEWELAALHKEPFTIYYGNEADVQAVLERFPQTEPEPVAEA